MFWLVKTMNKKDQIIYELMLNMRKLTTIFRDQVIMQIGRKNKLSPIDFKILVGIAENNHETKSTIAKFIDMPPPAMNRSLDRLLANNMIARTEDSKDKRYIRLSLTKSGAVLYEKVRNDLGEQWQKICNQLELEELVEFNRLTLKLKESICNEILEE